MSSVASDSFRLSILEVARGLMRGCRDHVRLPSWVTMWKPVQRDARDLALLREMKIEPTLVEVSFFEHAHDWGCPVCGAAKRDLIHRRRNGKWFSGIEVHHYGPESPADIVRYLSMNSTVSICYLCNTLESTMRKQGLVAAPMSVETMRASDEFMLRRRDMRVRNTYGTRDPKGRWNVDGTPRR